MNDSRLATTLCGIPLRNPVITASGTFAYGIEFEKLLDLNQLGAIVTKGLSREPIAGNPAPRLWNAEMGMINSVGLQNVGVRAFIRDKLPKLRRYTVPVVANVFGYRDEDYLEVVRALEDAPGIAAYELNVSCPNTKHGGMFFSSDPGLLSDLVSHIRPLTRRPLIVKLSPNVNRIQPVARAAQESGAGRHGDGAPFGQGRSARARARTKRNGGRCSSVSYAAGSRSRRASAGRGSSIASSAKPARSSGPAIAANGR